MTKPESDGYIADGQGGQERAALAVAFNLHIVEDVLDFSLRISEAGKKMGEGREMGVTLTPGQWRELIAGMQKQLASAEEFLGHE